MKHPYCENIAFKLETLVWEYSEVYFENISGDFEKNVKPSFLNR